MGTAGRPREFAKDRALEQALVLFWAKGYPVHIYSGFIKRHGYRSEEHLRRVRQ